MSEFVPNLVPSMSAEIPFQEILNWLAQGHPFLLSALVLMALWWAFPHFFGFGRTPECTPDRLPAHRAVVTWIHGTWARDPIKTIKGEPASWVRGFMEETKTENPQVQSQAFNWSGRNTTYARGRASRKLHRLILDAADQHHVIVGHSHGGTVAIEAARDLVSRGYDLRKLSIVSLSSPFFHVYKRVVPNVQLGGLFLLAWILPLASVVLNGGAELFLDWSPLRLVHLYLFPGPVALLYVYAARRNARISLAQPLVRDTLGPHQLCLIRASSDEASGALIIAQMLTWLSNGILWIFSLVNMRPKSAVFLGILGLVLAQATGHIAWWTGFGAAAGAVAVIAVVTALVAPSPIVGPLEALLSPYLEVAVEVAPMGTWTINYVNTRKATVDPLLNHQTYEYEEARDWINEWIRTHT